MGFKDVRGSALFFKLWYHFSNIFAFPGVSLVVCCLLEVSFIDFTCSSNIVAFFLLFFLWHCVLLCLISLYYAYSFLFLVLFALAYGEEVIFNKNRSLFVVFGLPGFCPNWQLSPIFGLFPYIFHIFDSLFVEAELFG